MSNALGYIAGYGEALPLIVERLSMIKKIQTESANLSFRLNELERLSEAVALKLEENQKEKRNFASAFLGNSLAISEKLKSLEQL